MRVAGIFPSAGAAHDARRALLDAGFDADRIAMTPSQTADGVAGEAPGQSYENQPGQDARSSKASWYATAIRGGDCALIVDLDSAGDRDRLGHILRANGAREVAVPRA